MLKARHEILFFCLIIVAPILFQIFFSSTPVLLHSHVKYPQSRSNVGNTYLWHKKANAKERLSICALGGSMTAGHGAGGRNFSWFSYLRKHIGPSHKYTNLASPGTGSSYAVSTFFRKFTSYDYDVIFVEYALNDPHIEEEDCDSRMNVLKSFEALVRSIRIYMPNAALIIIEGFRQSKPPRRGFASGQNSHDIIAKYYELPSVSIRDAVWHQYFRDMEANRTTSLTEAWPRNLGNHPSALGQALIADIIFDQWKIVKSQPPTCDRDFPLLPPLYAGEMREYQMQYIFDSPTVDPSYFSVLTTNGWTHVIEAKAKPGYICNDKLNNEFTIRNISACGQELVIGYLRSYSQIGNANVSITDSFHRILDSYELIGMWDVSKGSQVAFNTHNLPDNSYSVTIRMVAAEDRRKFKLTSIACT